MSTVAVITDQHNGVRNDALSMQTAQGKFYREVFFPTLDQHHIKTVIHAGDFFDRRKFANIATARFVHDTYQRPLRERNITNYFIVGNHDAYYRHTNEVNGIEEFYRHDPQAHIYSQPTEITVDGCEILLLPWIADNNRQASMQAIQTSRCPVVIGHLEISGFSMFRGIQNHEGLDPALFDRFELVMSGHFHHRSQMGSIHYLGAPFAMNWGDYKDPRGFHLFDTETHQLTFIENPYSLFQKIEYDDAGQKHNYLTKMVQHISAPDSVYHSAYVKVIVKSREQPYWFDTMMDALYKCNAEDIIVVDDITANDLEDTPSDASNDIDTVTLMREYIDTLTINCDKDALFAYLQTKYQEAIAASQNARVI